MISSSMLIVFYTIQHSYPTFTKFQNPRHSSSWEIFDTNFPMYYIGVRDGKRRQKLITESWFSFPQYTWPLSRCIQNLKTLAITGAENAVTKSFTGEKEKWINKGNDKQQHADSLLHNTTSHTQQISKSSAQQFLRNFDTNFPMYYIGVRDGKKEKWRKMVKINLSILVFCSTIYLATLKCIRNLKTGSHRSREICNWLERKKNKQIKEMVSIRTLILSYTMQQVIPNICTKFQNPRCSCSWEIFDANFLMYYTEVRDGKMQKWKKEG